MEETGFFRIDRLVFRQPNHRHGGLCSRVDPLDIEKPTRIRARRRTDCRDEAAFITGQVISPNGGQLI